MKRTASRTSAVAVILLGLGFARGTGAAEIANAGPLFEAHCFDCHGNGAKEGNLALDELL